MEKELASKPTSRLTKKRKAKKKAKRIKYVVQVHPVPKGQITNETNKSLSVVNVSE